MTVALQQRLDALTYPPTHEYELDGLKPRGVLAERVQRMVVLAPGFFDTAGSYLDVGCNKGYFTLRAALSGHITALDTNPVFVELCQEFGHTYGARLDVQDASLRTYAPSRRFDRAFLGNVHHYLFVESGGWGFIDKLAAVVRGGGQVLIEGPTGMDCRDLERVIPEALRTHYTRRRFLTAMAPHFLLRGSTPSPSYTPNREIMLFERRPSVADFRLRLTDLVVDRPLHQSSKSAALLLRNGMVAKVYQERLDPIAVYLAGLSPVSNGLTSFVVNEQDHVVGWTEPHLEQAPLRYFQEEHRVFCAYCAHQLWLLERGYVEHDPGTINWVVCDGRPILFDKNAVHPVSSLDEPTLADQIGQCFGQSYATLPPDGVNAILDAMRAFVGASHDWAHQAQLIDALAVTFEQALEMMSWRPPWRTNP